MNYALNTLLQTAWAMEPHALEVMAEIILRHEAGIRLSKEEIDVRIQAARSEGGTKASPGYQVIDGVAVIPVYGVIEKRAGYFSDISGMVSTLAVQRDLNAALKDEGVHAILLDIDSPGGSIDGVSDLGDAVYAARKKKPVYGYANGTMASAAYWIGAQAEKIFASRSAYVGSIGVYTVLYDSARAAENEGYKVHVVKAGDMKAIGIGGTPITPEQLKEKQRVINGVYDLFVTAIAVGRNLTEAQARELADGRVHIGEHARALGLVDGIASLEETIQKLKPTAKVTGSLRAVAKTQEPIRSQTMTEDEVKAQEKQRAKDLQAAFPKDPAFALKAIQEGWSVEKAKAEHHDQLELALAAKDKEVEQAKNAAKSNGLPALNGKEAPASDKPDASARADFFAKVEEFEKKGIARDKAVAQAVGKYPDLHKAMLEECNPGKADLVAARGM